MAGKSTSHLRCNGLDGSNLLAFLAAVGTLQVATRALPAARWCLGWEVHDGQWTPVLSGRETFTPEGFIEMILPSLQDMTDAPYLSFANNLNVPRLKFQEVVQDAYNAVTFANRHATDFVAALGCESLCQSVRKPDKNTPIQDTAFRTMSGAGHQHFLKFMRQLVTDTEPDHLRTALFAPWQYADANPNLRWDPQDDRRYALRWKSPSGDPGRTVRGANRLAMEALPLLPTAPGERKLHTTGFSQRPGEGVFFTWPIWEPSLGMDSVRSLLSLRELQAKQPDRSKLFAMGVIEVYRSQRITQGKYRNFTPAFPA